jgi:hypothetical protein
MEPGVKRVLLEKKDRSLSFPSISLASLASAPCGAHGVAVTAFISLWPACLVRDALGAAPAGQDVLRNCPTQFTVFMCHLAPSPPFLLPCLNSFKTQPPDLFIILGKEVSKMKLKCFQAHTILILFNRLS